MLGTNTFEQHVADERQRLTSVLKKAEERKEKIDVEIQEINRELQALEAYEITKAGKSRKKAGKRTGWRKDVLAVIKKHPQGIERSMLLEALSAKGDVSRERSVSNALNALKTARKINSENGIYKLA